MPTAFKHIVYIINGEQTEKYKLIFFISIVNSVHTNMESFGVDFLINKLLIL